MLLTGWNVGKPVTVAHVPIGETEFFRSEKESTRACRKMRADDRGGRFEALERMLEVAGSDGGSAYDEQTVRDGFSDGFELFGAGEEIGGTDGRACALECHVVGIHYPQVAKSEVAHGAGGCADVERIAGVYEDDAQLIELRRNRQDSLYFTVRRWGFRLRSL